MKIKKIKLSLFPSVYSIVSTRLIFTQTEISILQKAGRILRDAEEKVLEYLKDPNKYNPTFTLADIDPDLAEYFHAGFRIEELLGEMIPSCNGLKIE